jgi:hypothetical protein
MKPERLRSHSLFSRPSFSFSERENAGERNADGQVLKSYASSIERRPERGFQP